VDVSAVPFAYAGEPGALVFMRDASERRQAGEALRRAKDEAERALEDMAFIVEAADLGLWSNEWPLGALNWNRQVKEHFWLPPDHQPVIGEFFDILHPDDREPAQRAIDKAVADRGLFDATYRTVAPDGRQRWVRAMGRAIYGEDGSPVRFSGITQDVTAQKRLEADLRRSRDELEARVEERTRELQAKNKELQDFSFIASHDLQEPLRKVQAFGQRLREEFAACLGDDGRDYLRRMERAADRMQRLISDLLEYSRVATRTSPFVMSDLGEVARDALADLEQRIEETGGAIDVGDLPAAEVDRTQMRQVFQNLFANALKYHGPEPPRIRVDGEAGVRGDREVVRVRVRDNGIGFEEQFADRIFQPFQRLHGKNAYEGTGIGLAIVRKVVARHGGTVTAEGRPGQGATFIVELPRSQRQP
jgi:PAS domain S-box-containing protein